MNNKLKIKIKKLKENAVIPKYSNYGDAGLDLTITEMEYLNDNEYIKYKFGIAIEIPDGYVGLVFPRSSIYKKRQLLSNAVGVIDSGYRGEISAIMLGTATEYIYKIGDRCCQLIIIPYPNIEFEEVKELNLTNRGENGFGSTGN